MPVDLDAIETRLNARSPGEWHAELDCFDPDDPRIEVIVTNIIRSPFPSPSMLVCLPTEIKADGDEAWATARDTQEMKDAQLFANAPTDLLALIDELRESRDVLRVIEWVVDQTEVGETPDPFCPSCLASKRDGHHSDCRLAKLIGGAK